MANVVNGNTIYIDSTGTIASTVGMKAAFISVTATGANAVLVLQDTTTTSNKADLRVATSGETKVFDFSRAPIQFPNGIIISTLTNAIATIVFRRQGKGD